jgi:outer membrane protein
MMERPWSVVRGPWFVRPPSHGKNERKWSGVRGPGSVPLPTRDKDEGPWSVVRGPWFVRPPSQGKNERKWSGVRGPGSDPPPSQNNLKRLAAATMVVACSLGVASAEAIKLDAQACAARIVEVSHAAGAAGARADAAAATVKAADAATLPSLSASATVARRSSVPEFQLPFPLPGQQPLVLFPDITTTYGASLQLQQALYSGGAISGSRAAARHEADAAAAARGQTTADLRLAAQLAYWEAIRASANVGLARAQHERAKRLLDDTRALLGAGMAVRADVLAAEERIATAQVQVIAAENAAQNARAQLRSLLHLDPADHIELADTLIGPLPAAPAAAEQLQSVALAERPELEQTAAQLDALRSRERLARAEARPTIGAVAQWDYSRPNQRYFPQADEWKSSWSVGLLVSWRLFDGGKAQADTSVSRLTQRAVAEDRQELERRIQVEVETDRRNLESALAAVTAADAARAAALEREKDARDRHAAGLAPMVEILDAEAQLAAAEQQQVNARAFSWAAVAILARAVGQ